MGRPDFRICVAIHQSWLSSDAPTLRYEDLLRDDVGLLTETLLRGCRLPLSRKAFAASVLGCRFKALTGRPPGREDVTSHFRIGVAGDWQRHFTPAVIAAFAGLYGATAAETGYLDPGPNPRRSRRRNGSRSPA